MNGLCEHMNVKLIAFLGNMVIATRISKDIMIVDALPASVLFITDLGIINLVF